MKELYSCVPLREGWGGIVGWRREGDDGDDRKSLGVADEGIANVVIYGDCEVWSKMQHRWKYTQDDLQDHSDHIPIHSGRTHHKIQCTLH